MGVDISTGRVVFECGMGKDGAPGFLGLGDEEVVAFLWVSFLA
jgi:hypothetical protein